MGKGDSRRPPAVSDAELARRWEATFGPRTTAVITDVTETHDELARFWEQTFGEKPAISEWVIEHTDDHLLTARSVAPTVSSGQRVPAGNPRIPSESKCAARESNPEPTD